MVSSYDICVSGQVQGVGFRPHVYSIASELGLSGSVYNDGGGVQIKLVATPEQLNQFLDLLAQRLPPLAEIEEIITNKNDELCSASGFSIISSRKNAINTQISADAKTCDACLSELFDPNNRRYRYPFINCTHCGPRFSIIKKLPYDRPDTTMSRFKLCNRCQQEYDSPLNRRFHAQPNACNDCGPTLSLYNNELEEILCNDLLTKTVTLLKQGKIVAIKGLGGYHLVCDARNSAAVKRLRITKQRKTKPLALMAASLAALDHIVELTPLAKKQLSSISAPIVIVKKRHHHFESHQFENPQFKSHQFEHLAPNIDTLGVMLPYTPLHHLLFSGDKNGDNPDPLIVVMTSANLRGQPLIYQSHEKKQLACLADFVLTHNRDIDKRLDDSIVNCNGEQTIVIRRGRGMAPKAINLAFAGKATLAVGGFFKNSICLSKGKKAYLSQYIGNLDSPDNCRSLQETVAHMMAIYQIEPEQVASDLHPDFYSTEFAEQFASDHKIPLIKVQHHHAHAAAIACEHQLTGPYLALALDGVGLGNDGKAWGGECLKIEGQHCQRLGHFQPLTMPGGDSAAKQPWRIASAFLIEHGMAELAQTRFGREKGFSAVIQMLEKGVNCPQTSSAGRLFDAAGALLGLTHNNSFEAQAAMQLESAAA
ncbi:MAG: hydrogenase maturation protein HypF, partial [Psychromonas sp.]|uniref:carbamoyltransferase HypF n=1 Tax=Psychromonas sp. TaxID=1884585 RepID=UPI0039E6F8AB